MRAEGTDGYDENGNRFLQLFEAYQNAKLKKKKMRIKKMKAKKTDQFT
jgi:hypothetical protein